MSSIKISELTLQKRQAPSSDGEKKPRRSKATNAKSTDEKSYFLMKSEPDVFSIDDLESRPDATEPWDGVRNHQAKKILQAMRQGDQAFFYASNCKEPGIVGIVEIVKEAYPDPTQFDPKSEYYDKRSTKDAPRWSCVDVKMVKKLERPVSLAELKTHSDGALRNMDLFLMKRLSVQRVNPSDWEFVLGLATSTSSPAS